MLEKSDKISNLDIKFMSYAIALSRQNLGLTAENPSVGCVITCDGEILSTGATAKNGRPHAETIAIDKITNKKILKNCTIYLTLEPCSHFGKTNPCVDEIIKHEFARVVIACIDPNPLVKGSGVEKLKQSKIETVVGVLENQAKEVNRAFFKAQISKKPFVTLKLATSLDGKIAAKNFSSKWITCEKAREYANFLRDKNQAILIGGQTARQDNPTLDCRIKGLEEFSPQKLIISQSLNLDKNLNIFQKNPEKTIILTSNQNKFEQAKTIICKEKDGKIDLNNALEKICENKINSILIEGGSQIATQFLAENLIDELIWIRSAKIIGNDAIAAIGNMNFSDISQVLNNFKRQELKEIGNDLVEIFSKILFTKDN
jgi:diaminohydroxyphosphoribosylaminopyrimidine deaminase/5-amino-6-(5-phosphoribosylamino)uracil reductase